MSGVATLLVWRRCWFGGGCCQAGIVGSLGAWNRGAMRGSASTSAQHSCRHLVCLLQEVDEKMFSAYLEPQLGVEGERGCGSPWHGSGTVTLCKVAAPLLHGR